MFSCPNKFWPDCGSLDRRPSGGSKARRCEGRYSSGQTGPPSLVAVGRCPHSHQQESRKPKGLSMLFFLSFWKYTLRQVTSLTSPLPALRLQPVAVSETSAGAEGHLPLPLPPTLACLLFFFIQVSTETPLPTSPRERAPSRTPPCYQPLPAPLLSPFAELTATFRGPCDLDFQYLLLVFNCIRV